ncbi:MAG: triose-phosphate isomerase [Candidatus Liptonbacteria bacterium]|nr:triose-phosphate isomerase [Candidatus Liptonbacteria bacterium]
MAKLLVANWKLNPIRETEAVRLARASDAKGVVICPPFPFLKAVGKILRRAKLGAQDMFWTEQGAYTGEVSPQMLKKAGVEYVIVGHSERRRWLHETDEMIGKKVVAALKAGLSVVLCVGEPISVRRKGLAAAKRFAGTQLRKDLGGVSHLTSHISHLVITYEPLWAIGTGRADNPRDSAAMAHFIKKMCASRFALRDLQVLYGGSVTSKNIRRIFEYNEIAGALVGGASLNAAEFRKIIAAASAYAV